MQIWIMRIYFYNGKFCISNEEKDKTVGSHYFRRDRRALWSRRHWRIIGDVDNEIKVAEKKWKPAENWCIESSGLSSCGTLASLRHRKGLTKMRKQNARFLAAMRKAFTCCEINFSTEMPVIIVLSYQYNLNNSKLAKIPCKLKLVKNCWSHPIQIREKQIKISLFFC